MIEDIVKKKPGTFAYGTVMAVDESRGSVQVQLGTLTAWIQTSLSLDVGDTVIVARNDQDRSRLIIQHSQRSLPTQGTLLLI
jgi:hypothetical protein